MKKSRLLGAVSASYLLFAASITYAALVPVDLLSSGDGLLTRDTDTNLDWLDITETSGKSINEVLGGYGGYIGMGFRYSTLAEVITLYENAGIVIETPGSPTNQPTVGLLIDLMGSTTGSVGHDRTAQAYTGLNEPGPGLAYLPLIWSRTTLNQGGGAIVPSGSVTFDNVDGSGSYLVRSTVVPIPPAVWLFGSGLLGLIGMARRKKA